MTLKRVVILSGISTRMANSIGPSLRSMGTEISFVKETASGFDERYFDRLVDRTLDLTNRIFAAGAEKLHGLLVSAAPEESIGLERERFFPSFQRCAVDTRFRSDSNRSSQLVKIIMDTFSSNNYNIVAYNTSPQQDIRYLLPVRNSGLKRLVRHFEDVYEMQTSQFSRRLGRDIMKMKKGRGLRILGLNYKGVTNDGTHPVRRCTDTPICDLKARMRFGVSVHERFEFDLTCDTGLRSKTFFKCDGSAVKITQPTSHLNMRINDDFLEG